MFSLCLGSFINNTLDLLDSYIQIQLRLFIDLTLILDLFTSTVLVSRVSYLLAPEVYI
jgi:hypothetical protein